MFYCFYEDVTNHIEKSLITTEDKSEAIRVAEEFCDNSDVEIDGYLHIVGIVDEDGYPIDEW